VTGHHRGPKQTLRVGSIVS